MGGILLPARLLFVEFVSDDWFGSAGIIGIISISIIILAKKQKLGFFGPMLERQIFKFQKGKRGILVLGESVFLLVILGSMIIAIDQGNSVYSDLKLQNNKNLPSETMVLKQTEQWEADDWANGFLVAPIAFVTAFPQMSAAIASIDVEILGILIFYRVSYKKKIHSSVVNTIYKKAPIGIS
jgi:hypothetical protein